MMRSLFFICCLFLLFSQSESEAVPDFGPPVRGLIQLTGTFGELRSNHFHAGLDIRGQVGRPVYALADGYVSRLAVSGGGYGQVLYVHHPRTGHVAVYAHLDRFREDIMAYTRREQYAREQFALDIDLPRDSFPVGKGELIGYVGERGFVSGPHLHFEIRDAATDRALNPMNFGITVPDRRRPQIRALRRYELDERGRVLHGEDVRVRETRAGVYTTLADTLYTDRPLTALAVKAYDQQDGRPNLNGIYALELRQDDTLRFAYHMNHFLLEQTRYLNAHLDYEQRRTRNSWFQRGFTLPGNRLDIYPDRGREGLLELAPGQAAAITLNVSDHPGNVSTLTTIVKRRVTGVPLENPVYTYYLPYDEESIIENGRLRAHFPSDALYEDLYLDYDLVEERSTGLFAPTHRLHRATTPLHSSFDLHILPVGLPEQLRAKAVIVQCDDGGDPVSYGGEWTEEGRLRAPVRTLGNFTIMVDEVSPTVRTERFADDMRGWARFSFRINDNFPTAGEARDLRFRAEVDGRWILMEYDARRRRLYHDFDDRIPPGTHALTLRVTDDRGNETVVERAFRN